MQYQCYEVKKSVDVSYALCKLKHQVCCAKWTWQNLFEYETWCDRICRRSREIGLTTATNHREPDNDPTGAFASRRRRYKKYTHRIWAPSMFSFFDGPLPLVESGSAVFTAITFRNHYMGQTIYVYYQYILRIRDFYSCLKIYHFIRGVHCFKTCVPKTLPKVT